MSTVIRQSPACPKWSRAASSPIPIGTRELAGVRERIQSMNANSERESATRRSNRPGMNDRLHLSGGRATIARADAESPNDEARMTKECLNDSSPKEGCLPFLL